MSERAPSEAAGMLLIARIKEDFRQLRRMNLPVYIDGIYLGRDEFTSLCLVDYDTVGLAFRFALYSVPGAEMEYMGVPIYEVAVESHYGLGVAQ